MSDDDFWAEKTGELLGIGAAGVALALAPQATATALLALAPTTGAIAVRSLARRWGRVWEGFKSAGDGNDQAARERLSSYRGSEPVQDAVLETFRNMEAALDPDVLYALGRLLWRYTSVDRKPDRFFRNMGRMLTDLESTELQDLVRILREALKRARARGLDGKLSMNGAARDPAGALGVALVADMSDNGARELVCATDRGIHLFGLLKSAGFGFDEDRWGMSAAESLAIEMGELERVLDVIDVGA